jgi:integrase
VSSAQGSLAAYLTYWLENVAVHQLREDTHTRSTACVHRYLIPGLGKKKLTKLTAKDIRTWLNQLRTTCQCCAQERDTRRRACCVIGQCCDKRLSPLTVTYVHAVLKSALEHAVREDELPRNVARNVKTTTPRPRRSQPLTAAEARQFLRTAADDRLHALYELALRTGLRKGELLGLHWEDLDFDGGTATIHRSLQRTRSQGLTVLNTKTLASERRIALPTECINSLKIHQERQQEERQAAGTGWTDNGLVFRPRRPTRHGSRPLTLPSPLPSDTPEAPPEVNPVGPRLGYRKDFASATIKYFFGCRLDGFQHFIVHHEWRCKRFDPLTHLDRI